MAYGAVQDGISFNNQYQISRQTGNYGNTYKEGARIAAGWTGAAVGANIGARIGALGYFAGPVVGTITTVIGAGVGGAYGYYAGSEAVTNYGP